MDTLRLLQNHGYWTLFFGLMLEYLGLPIPGEVVLLLFGALVSWGKLDFEFVLAVGMAAVLLGGLFWYFAGRRGGQKGLRWFCRATLSSSQCLSRTETFYRKYGPASLLFAKFLPGFRVLAAPMAGMTGVGYRRFVLFDAMGGLLWVTGATVLGMLMAAQLGVMAVRIEHLGGTLWLIFILAALMVLTLRLRKRLKYGGPMLGSRKNHDPKRENGDARTR
jgi:membrane protein DedA with SNARE-associated domain